MARMERNVNLTPNFEQKYLQILARTIEAQSQGNLRQCRAWSNEWRIGQVGEA